MPYFRFVGGPCNGQTIFMYDPPALGFVVPCGGQDYTFRADKTLRSIGPSGSAPPVAPLHTQQVDRAWHKLMNALGVNGPAAIRRSRAGRSRMRRAVK